MSAFLRFTTSALLLVIFSVSASDIDNSYYTADVVIKTKSQAKDAALQACPVYDNKDIAFSMRWDDNSKANFKMQEIMHKHGIRGTFYMNGWDYDFRKACEKGTDIGSHSMTHPRLTNLNTNQIFREVAEIKPYLESRTDKPVNSYCFSYGNYRDSANPNIGYDIAEMLQRTGYHHNAYLGFIITYTEDKDPVSGYRQIVPGDRDPSMAKFERELKKLLGNKYWKKDHPNISIGVHVWMKTPEAWGKINQILKKYSRRPDWWYCTQTDYAAYRKMFKLVKISYAGKKAHQFKYKVTLPYASDIGSNQPLTLCFNGIASDVLVNDKPVKLKSASGKTFFELAPPVYAQIPRLISYTINLKNSPKPNIKKKTVLEPWLYINDKDFLVLTMKNGGADLLTNIKIKYILPLMYKYKKASKILVLASGTEKVITQKLTLGDLSSDRAGVPFLLCQVDYLNKGQPERAYASTCDKVITPPASNKFRDKVIVSSLFGDLDGLKGKLVTMSRPGSAPISDLQWYKSVDKERWLYPDYIAGPASRMTMKEQKFNKKTPYNAFDYSFKSDKSGTLNVIGSHYIFRYVPLFCVNGQEVPPKDMMKFKVKKGRNRIVFVFKSRWKVPPSLAFPYVIK
jgi:peptidoglycan/xylan/chitin deacetylase (PgdA/CDA1 family)